MPTDYGPSGSNAAPSTPALRTGPGVSDQGKLPDNDHPSRVIICSATGDWIEWEKPGLPEETDCPHGGCHCTPTLYDQRRITRGDLMCREQEIKALVETLRALITAGRALVPHMPPMNAVPVTNWDDAMGEADDLLGALEVREAE